MGLSAPVTISPLPVLLPWDMTFSGLTPPFPYLRLSQQHYLCKIKTPSSWFCFSCFVFVVVLFYSSFNPLNQIQIGGLLWHIAKCVNVYNIFFFLMNVFQKRMCVCIWEKGRERRGQGGRERNVQGLPLRSGKTWKFHFLLYVSFGSFFFFLTMSLY